MPFMRAALSVRHTGNNNEFIANQAKFISPFSAWSADNPC